uniref:Secreted protein n=1 Tax=Mesocestoides corti TaxID=53468 RepID=A0A5K3G2C3_MESCO
MEAAIDKCCDLKSLDDNWGLILQISDTYAVGQPKQCLKCISKKIFQNNPHTSMKALTLLDSCVKNAGNTFARELSSKDFISTFKQKYPKLHHVPQQKLLGLVRTWSEEYGSNPEFNLLATLYTWVRREHPSHIRELEGSLNAAKQTTNKEKEKSLQAKEEEDLAKAIALSLTDTGGRPAALNNQTPQSSSTPAGTAAYPALPTASSTIPSRNLGKVRALYDFEAAEDNELTFKAGEIIVVLDDSDPNWWKGSNHRGEGLFPVQFVTKDDTAEADAKASQQTTNSVTKVTKEAEEEKPARIDPQLLENCLEMLHDADPTGVSRPDPEELPQMESRCRAMEPLIDRELEEVDTRINDVEALKQRLLDAFAEYHDIVARSPPAPAFSAASMFPGGQQQQQQPVFNPAVPASYQYMYGKPGEPYAQQYSIPPPPQGPQPMYMPAQPMANLDPSCQPPVHAPGAPMVAYGVGAYIPPQPPSGYHGQPVAPVYGQPQGPLHAYVPQPVYAYAPNDDAVAVEPSHWPQTQQHADPGAYTEQPPEEVDRSESGTPQTNPPASQPPPSAQTYIN